MCIKKVLILATGGQMDTPNCGKLVGDHGWFPAMLRGIRGRNGRSRFGNRNEKRSLSFVFLSNGAGHLGMVSMALPFDLEDVVGVALADLVRRFLALWGCLLIGTVMAGTALMLGGLVEMVLGWVFHGGSLGGVHLPELEEMALGVLFGFFAGLFTSLGMVYGAFLIGLAIYMFRADAPHPYVWAGGAGGVALGVMSVTWGEYEWAGSVAALGFWVVLLAGLFFFARWRLMVLRVRAELHLAAVAMENDGRRRELQERTGGAVGDREFALGDLGERGDDLR